MNQITDVILSDIVRDPVDFFRVKNPHLLNDIVFIRKLSETPVWKKIFDALLCDKKPMPYEWFAFDEIPDYNDYMAKSSMSIYDASFNMEHRCMAKVLIYKKVSFLYLIVPFENLVEFENINNNRIVSYNKEKYKIIVLDCIALEYKDFILENINDTDFKSLECCSITQHDLNMARMAKMQRGIKRHRKFECIKALNISIHFE